MRCKYYRRPDTKVERWVVYLYWGGKKWSRDFYDDTFMLETERMALRIAELVNKDIEEKGERFDPRMWFGFKPYDLQFATYCDHWLSTKPKERDYSPGTISGYVLSVKIAKEVIGSQDMRTLDLIHLERFKAVLETRGLHPRTIKNHLSDIKTILKDASRAYKKAGVTLPDFPTIKVSAPKKLSIDRGWQDKIISHIPEWDRPIFRFLATYGTRTSEARALQWDCIDWEAPVTDADGAVIGKGLVTIKRSFGGTGTNRPKDTKTHIERALPMLEEITALLKGLRKRTVVGRHVFLNRSGRPYCSDINRIWFKAREEAGCPVKCNLKQGTRTSFATQHCNEPVTAQKALGHAELDVTFQAYTDQPVGHILRMIQRKKEKA